MAQQISFETFSGTPPRTMSATSCPAIGAPLAPSSSISPRFARRTRAGRRLRDRSGGAARGRARRPRPERSSASTSMPGCWRSRARRPADAAIEWHEASAEELPLADEAFDVAFCQLGLQFFADRPAALRRDPSRPRPGWTSAHQRAWPYATALRRPRRRAGTPSRARCCRVRARSVLAPRSRSSSATSHRRRFRPRRRLADDRRRSFLPPPADFLWQYVHSTPLAGPAADLEDEPRSVLEREVVAGWHPFIEDGALVLQQPVTLATARK